MNIRKTVDVRLKRKSASFRINPRDSHRCQWQVKVIKEKEASARSNMPKNNL